LFNNNLPDSELIFISTQDFLVFLCLQANAETVRNIPSYCRILLMQPSPFEFIKINPRALKLIKMDFRTMSFSISE